MNYRIEILPEKKFIGKNKLMSLSNNATPELWKSFMVERKSIHNSVGNDLYSIQQYPKNFFNDFDPNKEFIKWATTEVSMFENIPPGFKSLLIPKGLYAVFIHKGLPSEFPKTMQYILLEWLPNSDYQLDNRPHFEILNEKYKNNDPTSKEEVWIPIRKVS